MKEKQNPWLQIPAVDYEGHMSATNVGQLQVLGKIFQNVLNDFSPKSVCVLGCATGNGFEHLVTRNVECVVGVDINPEYISICKNRFEKSIQNLELVCADLVNVILPDSSFDLIHAALFFEYVDINTALEKISRWLKPDGVLCTVLQLPSDNSAPVSETSYESIKILSPFIKLVEPDKFIEDLTKLKFGIVKDYKTDLKPGKNFYIGMFKRNCCISKP